MDPQGAENINLADRALAKRRPGRPPKAADALSAVQRQRMATLEMLALWGGHVRRRDLMRAFDLSDGQVTQTISLYRRLAPSNLEVDPDTRAWRAAPSFSPHFIKGDTAEFLNKVFAIRIADIGGNELGCDVPSAVLPMLPVNFSRSIVSQIVTRTLTGQGLSIKYQSLDTSHPTVRTVWPHALIHTGYRWLMRCFDGKHGRFADLALARILTAGESDEECAYSPSDDYEWATLIGIRLRAAEHLSPGQKDIVSREYGFPPDGELVITLRASTFQYFLDFYGLRPGSSRSNTMLEIANYRELSVHDRLAHD